MPSYLTPGVYVEEVQSGARPIEGVGTAVAAFVGFAESGPFHQPTLVTNWDQYVQTFGTFTADTYLAPAVYGYFANGGGAAYIVRIGGPAQDSAQQSVSESAATAALGGFQVSARPGTSSRPHRRDHRRRGREPPGGPVPAAGAAGLQGGGDLRRLQPQERQGLSRHPGPPVQAHPGHRAARRDPDPPREPEPLAGARRGPRGRCRTARPVRVRRRRRRPHRIQPASKRSTRSPWSPSRT